MLENIDKTLKRREQLRRLEEDVGGRPKTFNPRTIVRPKQVEEWMSSHVGRQLVRLEVGHLIVGWSCDVGRLQLFGDVDKVNSEFALFTDASSAAIQASKPKIPRNQVDRDHYGAHDRFVAVYISEHPQYDATTFCTRLRMSRTLFTRFVQDITDYYPYFQLRLDCTRKFGIFALMKCTSAIRQTADDTIPDAFDEYLQMGATTARDSHTFLYCCNGDI
uniref:Uncharacterized protein n=1 Tax=Tanacetum cinerariifolium TaxID=118510 RepID=A0A6L2JYN4_TANCI|nr:hypothetical protein [Tanacetum cinerariifolium]